MLLRKTIYFLLLFILTESVRVSAQSKCSGLAANIMFVMDSSSSIWVVDYKKQLQFVQDLVDNFDIGADGTLVHVGAITFSDKAHLEFPVSRYQRKEDIKAAIGKIPYRRGVTNTAKALKLVKIEIEKQRKMDKAPFIVVVITDGQSRNPEATRQAADSLHKLGVHIYAIGVGIHSDLNELKEIASDPVENVYQVGNYSALLEMVSLFGAKTCKDTITIPAPRGPTTTTFRSTTSATTSTELPPTANANTIPRKIPTTTVPSKVTPYDNIDVIMQKDQPPNKQDTHTISFGFDLVSVGISQSNRIFQFISYILPLNYYGHFSIISEYDCSGSNTDLKKLNIPLMPLTNKTLAAATNSIEWRLPGLASIVHQLASNLYKRNINNSLRGVMGYEVTVLFFDSLVTKLTPELIKNVEYLKRMGSKVYVIDVGEGNWAEPKLLDGMSSQPSNRYTFKVPTYKQLLNKKHLPSYKFLADCRC